MYGGLSSCCTPLVGYKRATKKACVSDHHSKWLCLTTCFDGSQENRELLKLVVKIHWQEMFQTLWYYNTLVCLLRYADLCNCMSCMAVQLVCVSKILLHFRLSLVNNCAVTNTDSSKLLKVQSDHIGT